MKKIILTCVATVFLFAACIPKTKIDVPAPADQSSDTTPAPLDKAKSGDVMPEAKRDVPDEIKPDIQEMIVSDITSVRQEENVLSVTFKGNVFFDSGSVQVKPAFKAEIERIAEVLREYRTLWVRVEGHADSSEGKTKDLSRQRAEAVREILIQRGMNESQITAAAYSHFRPVMPGNTDKGRQKNRRAELKIGW